MLGLNVARLGWAVLLVALTIAFGAVAIHDTSESERTGSWLDQYEAVRIWGLALIAAIAAGVLIVTAF